MKRLWRVLKFIGRWTGPALLLAAIALLVFPPSPFFDLAKSPALAAGVVSAIAWLLARGPERKRNRSLLAASALVAFALFGWRQWEDGRGYRVEAVTFDNRGARLAGDLYLPDRPGKVPGIVWVHGSGQQTRGMNAPMAKHFARLGYAVLIFDKRGVGDSTGHYEWERSVAPENIELLASDASAALAVLAERQEVRREAVGFVGVSQAGWITPRAAVLNGHAAFMVLLSGPTTSTHAFMRYERFHLGPPSKTASAATAIKAFMRGDIPAGMTPDQADAVAQRTQVDVPFPDHDPVADLRALDVPGLWLLGGSDWMVPSGPTARRIDALRALGKPYEYRHIPGAIHGMLLGPKDLILTSMDEWLAKVTASPRRD